MNSDELHEGEMEEGGPRLVLACLVGLNQGVIYISYGVDMGEPLAPNLIVLSDLKEDDDPTVDAADRIQTRNQRRVRRKT